MYSKLLVLSVDTVLSDGFIPLKHQARASPKGPLEKVFLEEEINPGEITLLPDLPQSLLAFLQGASFLYIHNVKRIQF